MLTEEERLRRRIFLLTGWGRFALSVVPELRKQMERIVKEREHGQRGVAVDTDDWALAWQRRNYRKNRTSFALGEFGVIGQKVWNQDGFHESTSEELLVQNRGYLAKYRAKATAAARRFAVCGDPLERLYEDEEEDQRARDAVYI